MKKLVVISILLTFLTAAAFAQFKVTGEVVFQGDILKTAAPIDNARDTSKSDTYLTGSTGYEKRYFNFLSSMNSWVDSGIKLNFKYTDPSDKDAPKYGGLLQLDIGGLWAVLIAKDDANKASLMNIVQAPFGDVEAWGKVGILRGFVGNTADRGATADVRGAHYNDYMDKFKFENLGIMKMATLPGFTTSADGAATFAGAKHNDVDGSRLANTDGMYAAVEADLGIVKAAVAGDLTGIAKTAINQQAIDSHTGIGAGFRVSGDIAIVKFDALYKVTGGDPITDANQGVNNSHPQPDGGGNWAHQFGVYGNANLGILGVTVGYTGAIDVKENAQQGSYVSPYYSGIDLRAYFNLMEALKLSFNNNVSFSYMKGSNDASTTFPTVISGSNPMNNSEYSDGYFGMYNALLADFMMTPDLKVTFQVGNRWYSTTWTDNRASKVLTRTQNLDELQLTAGGFYSLGDHVTLGSGLAFNLYHQTLKDENENETKTGLFTFGIPLTVKVVY